jgi:hypothetical protein
MIMNIDIPDNAREIKVVLCDGKPVYKKNERYEPGYWNGLCGGQYYGQYFEMDDIDRVRAMTEIASLLKSYGVKYYLSKFKRQYRITISERDYRNMGETLKAQIHYLNVISECP